MAMFSMLKITLANLFRKPATNLYPFVPGTSYPNTRGEVENAVENCIFCGICQRRCPSGAITVDRAKGEWKIDRLRCIVCGNCADLCPKKCLTLASKYPEPTAGTDKQSGVKVLRGTPPAPPAAKPAPAPGPAPEGK
ncbi:MAG: 4Fe-4S dicluster domain-containing protein [Elusimicrobiaceae bacterium]|nr:4Fe-4S dicluster domain-containing protein [Elusimicrobiaceae bacterium]